MAFVVGDYAKGMDTGTIHLVLVGSVDQKYLLRLIRKAKDLLHRNVSIKLITAEEFENQREKFKTELLVWQKV